MTVVAAARVWARPARKRVPVEITIALFALACGLTRRTMLRRLREYDVIIHRRGKGTRRKHGSITIPEIRASDLSWILDAIDWSVLALVRRPLPGEDDDDEKPEPRRGRDGVWR